jgi:hypothetical protein
MGISHAIEDGRARELSTGAKKKGAERTVPPPRR